MEKAFLAGGCFWCTEAIFKRLKGVFSVTPGYSGGGTNSPSYEQVSSGKTGHTEAIEIEFDPEVISYEKLLEVFFKLHDPTTLNQQGNDIGTQYRSVIFYIDEKQKKLAEKAKQEAGKTHQKQIVTEIVPFKNFFKAENYHLDYYAKNSDQLYCKFVIDPKIVKLYKEFKEIAK